MDKSSLKSDFFIVAAILFVFLMYQRWHDAHFPAPSFIMDTSRHIVIGGILVALIIIFFKMIAFRSKEKEKARFDAEENERKMRCDAIDKMELGEPREKGVEP